MDLLESATFYLHLVIHSAYFLDRGLDKQSISISAILNYEILETTTQHNTLRCALSWIAQIGPHAIHAQPIDKALYWG